MERLKKPKKIDDLYLLYTTGAKDHPAYFLLTEMIIEEMGNYRDECALYEAGSPEDALYDYREKDVPQKMIDEVFDEFKEEIEWID